MKEELPFWRYRLSQVTTALSLAASLGVIAAAVFGYREGWTGRRSLIFTAIIALHLGLLGATSVIVSRRRAKPLDGDTPRRLCLSSFANYTLGVGLVLAGRVLTDPMLQLQVTLLGCILVVVGGAGAIAGGVIWFNRVHEPASGPDRLKRGGKVPPPPAPELPTVAAKSAATTEGSKRLTE